MSYFWAIGYGVLVPSPIAILGYWLWVIGYGLLAMGYWLLVIDTFTYRLYPIAYCLKSPTFPI